jgi:hypothetical protein
MKKLLAIFGVLGLLSSCQQTDTRTTTSDPDTLQLVGGDLDEHGCKGSAGYTWSVVKNDCIRIFEAGVRLDAVDSTLDQTFSAFVVFADDERENEVEAELFLPSGSHVLKPIKDNGAGTWRDSTYTLTQWKGMYSLDKGEKLIYQGHR